MSRRPISCWNSQLVENDVFIAATFFGYTLSDTLNIEVSSDYAVRQDTISLQLTNTAFEQETYAMDRGAF